MCYLELGYDHESAHALSGRLAPGSVTRLSFPFENIESQNGVSKLFQKSADPFFKSPRRSAGASWRDRGNFDVKSMDIASKA